MDYSIPGSSVHGILQAEYWSGLPFPPPGDLPVPGTESRSPARSMWDLSFLTSDRTRVLGTDSTEF